MIGIFQRWQEVRSRARDLRTARAERDLRMSAIIARGRLTIVQHHVRVVLQLSERCGLDLWTALDAYTAEAAITPDIAADVRRAALAALAEE